MKQSATFLRFFRAFKSIFSRCIVAADKESQRAHMLRCRKKEMHLVPDKATEKRKCLCVYLVAAAMPFLLFLLLLVGRLKPKGRQRPWVCTKEGEGRNVQPRVNARLLPWAGGCWALLKLYAVSRRKPLELS